MRKEHLPNVITVSRLLVVPFGLYVHDTLSDGDLPGLLSLLVLVWLIASDFLDGILARKWHAESDLGRSVDPVVDKTFLVTTLLVYAAAVDSAIFWAVVILRLVPDALTFLVGVAEAATKKVKDSAFWGKRKTEVDFIALLVGYTPLLLTGKASYHPVTGGLLMVSTVLGFVAFGYYLRRYLKATREGRPVA